MEETHTVGARLGYATEVPDATPKDSVLNSFDQELERYEKSLDRLRHRLDPVMSRYGTLTSESTPRPEPSSEVRARLERLSMINAMLADTIDQIDL